MPFHPQPLFFIALGLIAGTLVPGSQASISHALALGLAGLVALIAILWPRTVPLVALIVAAAAAGSALSMETRAAWEARALPRKIALVEGSVLLEGRLAEDPQLVDDEMRLEVDARRIVAEGRPHEYRGRVRLIVRGPTGTPFSRAAEISKGDELRTWVDLRVPEPVRTPGGFDQLGWAMREGIHVFATCKSERLLQVVRRGRPRGWTDRARDRLRASWQRVEGPPNRAVTASMVLGDEGALDALTRSDFRSAGLLHLLVVSGSQVAALIIGLRRLLPMALRIAWRGCAIECAILFAYCALAGAGDSIVRATVMAAAFSVSIRVDLKGGGANFLAAAAIVVLCAGPLDVLDPGAQMSFAATLALVTFAGPASRQLEARRVPGLLADVLSATLVASLAVAPLSLIHFHRFSLIALPANLIAAPLAALLLYASLATALLDAVLPIATGLAASFCSLTAESLRSIAHHAAALDPDWRGPAPPWPVLAGLLGLVACRGWRRIGLPAAGLLGALSMSGLPLGDGRLHVWFLDVGQGDSMIVETPDGKAGVIDAGPAFDTFDAGERIVAEALWALGHPRLDFLVVTHRHADHEGGGAFLARHFAPERIYVNAKSPAFTGPETTVVGRGDGWTLGNVSFRVMAPDAGWPLPSRDENARSLVIELRHQATSFLLMGDASRLTETFLEAPREPYDVVKVGHHGAVTSSSPAFVALTHPKIAVISVGARNRFAHPSPQVVERWTRSGALVWRTDRLRTLHVTSNGSGVIW